MPKNSNTRAKTPPKFKLGEEVIAVFPDTVVLPLVVGQTYIITNMKYDTTWGWYYEIENYKGQVYDEVEFVTFFRHKHDIKEDITKEENLKKFMRLASFISVKEGERYRFSRRIDFDEEKFRNDELVEDLKQDPELPFLMKKMKKLINIIDFDPEYADKEIEDLWIYL